MEIIDGLAHLGRALELLDNATEIYLAPLNGTTDEIVRASIGISDFALIVIGIVAIVVNSIVTYLIFRSHKLRRRQDMVLVALAALAGCVPVPRPDLVPAPGPIRNGALRTPFRVGPSSGTGAGPGIGIRPLHDTACRFCN